MDLAHDSRVIPAASRDMPRPGDRGTLSLFIDGSSKQAAAAAVLLHTSGYRELVATLAGDPTHPECELRALALGLAHITRSNIALVVHTDQDYLVGLFQGSYKPKKHAALVARIAEQLESFASVTFIRVSKGEGHPCNARATALAKGYF